MEGCAWGQVLHGWATTTAVVRRAIHRGSLKTLAKRDGINQKAVAKWRTTVKANGRSHRRSRSSAAALDRADENVRSGALIAPSGRSAFGQPLLFRAHCCRSVGRHRFLYLGHSTALVVEMKRKSPQSFESFQSLAPIEPVPNV